MILRDIIQDSTLSIIATVTGPESLEKAKFFLEYNDGVLSEFKHVHLHVNYTEDCPLSVIADYVSAYYEYTTQDTVYDINRSHMFGTIDLDEECLKQCKTKYLWKSTEDVVLFPQLLDKEVEERDFYYLPGFSYESICNAGSVDHLIENYTDWYYTPQSNFFILDTTKVTSLYGKDIEEKRLAYLSMKEKYPNLKPWEMNFPDGIKFACEDMLGVQTKHLTKQCLLNLDSFKSLANFVNTNRIGNPAHPNIFLKEIGVCHLHNYKSDVYEV